jgi:hypothetical protein
VNSFVFTPGIYKQKTSFAKQYNLSIENKWWKEANNRLSDAYENTSVAFLL